MEDFRRRENNSRRRKKLTGLKSAPRCNVHRWFREARSVGRADFSKLKYSTLASSRKRKINYTHNHTNREEGSQIRDGTYRDI